MSARKSTPAESDARSHGTVRLAVCGAPPVLRPGDPEWSRLSAAVSAAAPDLLLLHELPFGPWLAASPHPDPSEALGSCRLHDEAIAHLAELGAPIILGSRPVCGSSRPVRGGSRIRNQAFIWSGAEAGHHTTGRERTAGRVRSAGHTKQYFPDEEGYWEARWYEPGEERFGIVRLAIGGVGLRVGFLICTDLWFNEHARAYGRAGADLLAVPRATPPESTERWLTALRMAALVSGSYAASSNRGGTDPRGQRFGGHGWIVSPEGEVLAETSSRFPVAVAELDLALIARARTEYPRYVEEG